MMTPPRVQMIAGSVKARRRFRRAHRQLLRLMPRDGNIDTFVRAVEDYRGRRIVITPEDVGPGEPPAAWILHADYDEIRIDRRATPAGYVVGLCHEFGHMFLGHDTDHHRPHIAAPPPTWITAEAADEILHRSRFTRPAAPEPDNFRDPIEREPEQIATMLATEARRRQAIAEASSDAIGRILH